MKYPTSPINLQTHEVPSPFFRRACRLLPRFLPTIPYPNSLFSIACSLFSKNTRVGGATQLVLSRWLSDSRVSISTFASFARPLFSYSYELLFPQTLCFDIHLRCPGVWGSTRNSNPSNSADSASLRYQFGQGSPQRLSYNRCRPLTT
jgi:hypothetical protein